MPGDAMTAPGMSGPREGASESRAGTAREASPAKVALVVTAFRIGNVLADTLHSALSQRGVRLERVLLVVDGCPETATTGTIARRFSAAMPDLFQVIWLRNGGVSRARNIGVRWLLSTVPDLEAIYFLDGDDLIPPGEVASSMAVLRNAQEADPDRKIGWVYSHCQNFGDNRDFIDGPEEFLESSYLAANLSQPSCLYSCEMFRDGVLWDESMRAGIEDWEYWLAAIEAGYHGVFNPAGLLYYRRLIGNRSSLNRVNDSFTIPYMRQKHAGLYEVRSVLREEQERFPRYAFGREDSVRYAVMTDPAQPGGNLPFDRAVDAIAAQAQRDQLGTYLFDPYFPDVICLMPHEMRSELLRRGLLRSALYHAEVLFSRGAHIVEGVIEPLLHEQRQAHGAHADLMFAVEGKNVRRGAAAPSFPFVLLKLSALCRRFADQAIERDGLFRQAARLLIRSDELSRHHLIGRLGSAVQLRGVVDMAGRLKAATVRERRLASAQARDRRIHVSGRRTGTHGHLSQKLFSVAAPFPLLPSGEEALMAILLSPGAEHLDNPLFARLGELEPGDLGIGLFGFGHLVPPVPDAIAHLVRDRAALHLWAQRVFSAPEGHQLGLPPWQKQNPDVVARLAGMLSAYDLALGFDLEVHAPLFLGLRGLGVATIDCEPLPCAAQGPSAGSRRGGTWCEEEDPMAANAFAAAYGRSICFTGERADRLVAAGFPAGRIDMQAQALLAGLGGAERARGGTAALAGAAG
jgi:GT2 family glycosyltransferase